MESPLSPSEPVPRDSTAAIGVERQRSAWRRPLWPDLVMVIAACLAVLHWISGPGAEFLVLAGLWAALWTAWLIWSRRIWGAVAALAVFPICFFMPWDVPNPAFGLAQSCLENRAEEAFWQFENDPAALASHDDDGNYQTNSGRCGFFRYNDLNVDERRVVDSHGTYQTHLVADFRGSGQPWLRFYGGPVGYLYTPTSDNLDGPWRHYRIGGRR